MALIVHSPSTLSPNKPYPHLPSYSKPNFFSIKSQDPSTQPPNPTQSTDNKPNPKPAALGFGSPSSTPSTSNSSKKQKGKRERASIIRRAPVEKPAFVSKQDEGKFEAQSESERAFVLAWLGLGSLIILEGILLAASGFLPEKWDKFFVKYLYPSFTPTVLLFFAGTIVYGVSKYLQNETSKNQD